MPDAASDSPPDRLCNDPRSPYFNAEALARDVGIRFKGVEKTNVEEYCISEGWVRVAAGVGVGGLVDERDADGAVFGARGFRRRQRRGEAGGALADDDDVVPGHGVPPSNVIAGLDPAGDL